MPHPAAVTSAAGEQDHTADAAATAAVEDHPGRAIRAADSATMILVAAGPFLRGSAPPHGEPDERPQRRIELAAFWIDETEVTVGAYRRCVAAGACSEAAVDEGRPGRIRRSCNAREPDRSDHPINCVRRDQATAFCSWAGARLPSEAEWEKAARGTDGRDYPWGNEPPSCERVVWEDPNHGKACGRRRSWPVGSRPSGASPYGLLDMSGNVWEWVSDAYDATWFARAPDRDPPGPSSGVHAVARGGGYGKDGDGKLRAAARLRLGPSMQLAGVGFRCASTERPVSGSGR